MLNGSMDHKVVIGIASSLLAGYNHNEEQVIRHKILDRVLALPGVEVASLTEWIPMTLGHKREHAYPEGYVPHHPESLPVLLNAMSRLSLNGKL